MQSKYIIGWIGLFSLTLIVDIVLMFVFKSHFFEGKKGDKTLDYLIKEWSTNAVNSSYFRSGSSSSSCPNDYVRLFGHFPGTNDTCETTTDIWNETRKCNVTNTTETPHRVNNETIYRIGDGVICIG